MAATTHRWAIAPPALEEETDELEEFPQSNESHTNVTERRVLSVSDDPQVHVEGSPSGWMHDEVPHQPPFTERPSVDRGRADQSLVDQGPTHQTADRRHSVPPDEESFDTIPAPTWLGDE